MLTSCPRNGGPKTTLRSVASASGATQVSLTFKNQGEPTDTQGHPRQGHLTKAYRSGQEAGDSLCQTRCTGKPSPHLPPMLLPWDPKHQAYLEAEATWASVPLQRRVGRSELRSEDNS